ncbi:MAG: hypothetical protein JSW40_08200 [Candidatus Omnitrophota bacterium]|nr:MAG: hypothetical protein JSW40_08200 [Candidatus Omnitrophota bacterium]
MPKILFIISMGVFTLSCFSQDAVSSATPAHQEIPQEIPLQLIIDSNKNVYRINEDIRVAITIKNTSKGPLRVQTIPSLQLESQEDGISIWAPIRLDRDNRYIALNDKKPVLRLAPRQKRELKYNLSMIKWGSVLSSYWPAKSIKSLISPGTYTLSLSVEMRDKAWRKEITSNEITFKIIEKKRRR